VLKEHDLKPWQQASWCVADIDDQYIERMEAILDLYEKPYDLIEHQVPELLIQRINGLALGHEDINDHDRLRLDSVHVLLAGKTDVTSSRRQCSSDRGKALAGHATLNRLENSAIKLTRIIVKLSIRLKIVLQLTCCYFRSWAIMLDKR